MKPRYDIIVLGSGFAGSLMAMIARRLGHSVALLEKGTHPRMAIGESSTPLSNLLLEEIADRYDLPALRPLAKWGTWQAAHPEVACGLKRGFTFLHHDPAVRAIRTPADRQLLVAASPNDAIADTHWFRADFDQLLLRQACDLGVDYVDQVAVTSMARESNGWTLGATRSAQEVSVHAKLIIDATGPRGCLFQTLGLKESPLPNYPQTSALYSHFSGVDEVAVAGANNLPYPPNAAALHHVFEGGWMWVLRFNNGVTSAGFALSEALTRKFNLEQKETAWQRLMEGFPEIASQFRHATALAPLTYVPRLSFRSSNIAGRDWVMLPSAAGFVDPLLSTGFPLVLLGISRLACILEQDWNSLTLEQSLRDYAAVTDAELLATADLLSALYANSGDFPTFRALCLLYFAAASYSETARRLNKPDRANSFLLQANPDFGPEFRRICQRSRQPLNSAERSELQQRVYTLIEPFDVAGLGRRPLDHCYPVATEDLYRGAHKLDANHAEIASLIKRSGMEEPSSPVLT